MADEETYEGSEDSYETEDSYDAGEDSDSFVDTEGSDNSYTEVTHQTWSSRLQEQKSKSIAGLVLFLAAFPA